MTARRVAVVAIAAVAFSALSLIVASSSNLDWRLGTAPVRCPAEAVTCEGGMETGDSYQVLFLPWPPVTWYSLVSAAVGGVLGLLLLGGIGVTSGGSGEEDESESVSTA